MEAAIKIYRDTFRLNLKTGFKKDIVSTVKDLPLWKTILIEWKEKRWSPFKINWMLSEYERREQNGTNATNGRSDQRVHAQEVSAARLPKRGYGRVRYVREGARVHVRADCLSLEEIVTSALRKNHQSETEVSE